MITLTTFKSGVTFYLNPDHIILVRPPVGDEEGTVIDTTDTRLKVRESPAIIASMI